MKTRNGNTVSIQTLTQASHVKGTTVEYSYVTPASKSKIMYMEFM